MSRSSLYSPASPSTLSMSTCISERSPTLRKRGKVAATTTESRTVTSACADPTLSFDQATAVSRTEPLNAGRSNETDAFPWSSTLTTPENSASGSCVGRLPSTPPLGVAAGMNGAGLALHAVDQHAPEIADLDRQLALPEEIGARVRRLEAGQIENADIDRRDGHPRLLARREAGEMNGQRHRLTRPRSVRRVELDVERVRAAIDGEPGDAQARGQACASPQRRADDGSARRRKRRGPSRRRPQTERRCRRRRDRRR